MSQAMPPSRLQQRRHAARTWELLRRHPSTDGETYHRLADYFLHQGQLTKAVQVCRLWIEHCPEDGQAHFDLANLLFSRQDFVEALEEYRWLSERFPEQVDCYDKLGICSFQCGRFDEAAEALGQAVTLRPEAGERYERWAQALFHADRLPEAEAGIRRAIQLQPDRAPYRYCLAYILREWNRVGEAINALRHALVLQSDYREARWHLCHLLLLSGRYSEAWETDTWWRCELKDTTSGPLGSAQAWDGMCFGGQTLLLRWNRGYGDNFQCWRYLPAVKALGGTVLLEAPPEVSGLLQRNPDLDRIVTPGHDLPIPCDYYCSALDLPHLFCTTVDEIPPVNPLLQATKAKVRTWESRCQAKGFKVAVVWAGDPDHGNDRQRSCPLKLMADLTQVPGVTLFSLQKGKASSELSQYPAIVDLGSDCTDFADTAAVLHHMNLVISVDTAVLHLAGIMGKPTWGLIPYAPDWRWLLDREDCPWYPSVRLFRQTKRGNWEGVFLRVARELGVTVGR